MKKTIAIILIGTLTGCMTVRDYDAEKLEYEQVTKLKKAQQDPFNSPPTPSYVKVANDPDEGIYVEAIKLKPITGPQNTKLELWTINAVNTSNKDKCLTINWKLQDFEMEQEQPYTFLAKAKVVTRVGKMRQSIWSFDDAMIAIPPSGYVDGMKIVDPAYEEKTKKFTCDVLEKDIQEPGEDD